MQRQIVQYHLVTVYGRVRTFMQCFILKHIYEYLPPAINIQPQHRAIEGSAKYMQAKCSDYMHIPSILLYVLPLIVCKQFISYTILCYNICICCGYMHLDSQAQTCKKCNSQMRRPKSLLVRASSCKSLMLAQICIVICTLQYAYISIRTLYTQQSVHIL